MHDNGTEFIGHDFQQPLQKAGIKSRRSSVYNPQGNSICERSHLTVAQSLRVPLSNLPPNRLTTQAEADDLVDTALAIAQHATRSTSSTALLNQSPGSIAFSRYMLLNIPYIANPSHYLMLANSKSINDFYMQTKTNCP
jgi:hypothetical protein